MKRVILFHDGSATAVFDDGSGMALSSKGTTLEYLSCDGKTTVRQFTPFATFSSYNEGSEQDVKNKLQQLVHFVNKHVEQPYLCSNIILNHHEIFRSKVSFERASWKMCQESVKFLNDGQIEVTSEEKSTVLTLSLNSKIFWIRYPAKILDPLHSNSKYRYIFLNQMFSVHQFPKRWKIALDIALHYHYVRYKDPNHLSPNLNSEYVVDLPTTREPLNVKRFDDEDESSLRSCMQYLTLLSTHDYDMETLFVPSAEKAFTSDVLLEYTPHATYKFIPYTLQVEIILHHNGDVLLSSEQQTHFCHWSVSENNTPEEHLYHIKNIPKYIFLNHQTTSIKYPLADIIQGAQRFLVNAIELNKRIKTTRSSPSNNIDQFSSEIIVEQNVEGLARFTLYADGRVGAIFQDRTMLKMQQDTFHIISKYGEQLQVTTTNPLQYEDYIGVTIDFLKWANRTDKEKQQELEDSMHRMEIIKQAENVAASNQIYLTAIKRLHSPVELPRDFNALIMLATKLSLENNAILRKRKKGSINNL
jgi:hypothetical protein